MAGTKMDNIMEKQMITKREFLKLGVTSFLTACAGCKPKKEQIKRRIPVGVQLYSVRHECEKDLPGTIQKVAKMGYKGVEFAGYYGRDAKTLRKLLDDTGLVCCGTHTQIDTLLGDELPKTIEFNKTIGNKFLIAPGLPGKYRSSRKAWQETAKLFTQGLAGNCEAVQRAIRQGKTPRDAGWLPQSQHRIQAFGWRAALGHVFR
jgi:hypothetical protein